MHRRQWILAAALLAATSLSPVSADQAAFQRAVLGTDGLIGYWAWEGSLADMSANNNHGVARGNVTFSGGINGGRALHIENPNDEGNFVAVPAPIGSIFDQPNFSIVTFARFSSFHAQASGDWNAVMERNSLWYMEMEPFDNLGGGRLVGRIYDPADPANNGSGRIKDDAHFARTNAWHRYAFTYDGGTVRMYTDGVKVTEQAYAGGVGPTGNTPANSPNNNYDLSFGAWQQKGDWFTGDIDDSAYFNRALTDAEIQGLDNAMMGGGATPTTTPTTPTAADLKKLEDQVFVLVNQARAAAGLAPYNRVPELDAAARRHSLDQSAHCSGPTHDGSDGSGPFDRITAAGYTNWTFLGENTAAGQWLPIFDEESRNIMDAWMNENPNAAGKRPHRDNILRPTTKDIGIAVAFNENCVVNGCPTCGRYFWTQTFGTRF